MSRLAGFDRAEWTKNSDIMVKPPLSFEGLFLQSETLIQSEAIEPVCVSVAVSY